MTAWFTSRKGALTLSFFASLSLLARSYYDTRFILVEEFSPLAPEMDIVWILGFTAIVGGNMLTLLVAANGGRRAWIALLVYNLITGLGFGAASLVAYSRNPLEIVIFTASLITGAFAAWAVGWRLRQSRAEPTLESHNVT